MYKIEPHKWWGLPRAFHMQFPRPQFYLPSWRPAAIKDHQGRSHSQFLAYGVPLSKPKSGEVCPLPSMCHFPHTSSACNPEAATIREYQPSRSGQTLQPCSLHHALCGPVSRPQPYLQSQRPSASRHYQKQAAIRDCQRPIGISANLQSQRPTAIRNHQFCKHQEKCMAKRQYKHPQQNPSMASSEPSYLTYNMAWIS